MVQPTNKNPKTGGMLIDLHNGTTTTLATKKVKMSVPREPSILAFDGSCAKV